MPRFVFRQKTDAPKRPVSELARRACELGGTVLSQTTSMLCVEGSASMYDALLACAPDFVATPEVRHDLPKPPKITTRSGVKSAGSRRVR